MPHDKLHLPFRPSPGSQLAGQVNRFHRGQQETILNETSALHGIFRLPSNSETIHFDFLNPALRQLLNLNDTITVPNYFGQNLRIQAMTNDWTTNPTVSLVTSLEPPESKPDRFLGITVESVGKGLFHLTGRDITDKEKVRQQQEYAINHDPYTGYLNAIGWEKLSQHINTEKRVHAKPKSVTMFYIDLAGVKTVNDLDGHDAGNRFIVESFHRIATCFRQDDIFIRIHTTGDELVVYLPDINQTDVAAITQRLTAFREKYSPEFGFYFGSASGTPNPTGNIDFSDIIARADLQQIFDKDLVKNS